MNILTKLIFSSMCLKNIRACSSNIKKDLGLTTETGALKDNVKKNRYKDILPYDQTRVPLTLLTRENDSDYINASFIKGATKTRKYIATQGPLSNTLVDFWRMIWQYDVKVIIMACREFENGKVNCPFLHLLFTKKNWRSWPDHDIPYKADGVLGMMDMARKTQGNNTSPILIHCSAGCGRTGVICVLDYVHELLVTKQIKEHFSIQDIVIELRRQRPSAVQTKVFYLSCIRCTVGRTIVHFTFRCLWNLHLHPLVFRDSSLQPKEPKHLQRKMNDTYAVVNKSKQLPPPESSVTPLSTLHHYDNAELGTSKCPVGAVYSSVKPKTRCPPANLPPAASSVYDTARPSNHMLEKALSTVSGFNCRIKKPKGPRDPPAEWSRVER
uniref:protein-tyrosine-phosphatase n=1 Tax=Esox lucius TaxID=8010 RepID=A0A3P8Y7W8_ESOLU